MSIAAEKPLFDNQQSSITFHQNSPQSSQLKLGYPDMTGTTRQLQEAPKQREEAGEVGVLSVFSWRRAGSVAIVLVSARTEVQSVLLGQQEDTSWYQNSGLTPRGYEGPLALDTDITSHQLKMIKMITKISRHFSLCWVLLVITIKVKGPFSVEFSNRNTPTLVTLSVHPYVPHLRHSSFTWDQRSGSSNRSGLLFFLPQDDPRVDLSGFHTDKYKQQTLSAVLLSQARYLVLWVDRSFYHSLWNC